MARQKMVTRTVTGTNVTVMCLNVETAEPFNETLSFGETFKTEEKALKAAQAEIDNDTVKAVHVVSLEEFQTLYGMKETDFIKSATVLPLRGVKAVTADTESEVNDTEG